MIGVSEVALQTTAEVLEAIAYPRAVARPVGDGGVRITLPGLTAEIRVEHAGGVVVVPFHGTPGRLCVPVSSVAAVLAAVGAAP